MNHGDWVQMQIDAIQRRKPTPLDRRRAAAGRGWYAAPKTLMEKRRNFLASYTK